jgi:hypothetical protein
MVQLLNFPLLLAMSLLCTQQTDFLSPSGILRNWQTGALNFYTPVALWSNTPPSENIYEKES